MVQATATKIYGQGPAREVNVGRHKVKLQAGEADGEFFAEVEDPHVVETMLRMSKSFSLKPFPAPPKVIEGDWKLRGSSPQPRVQKIRHPDGQDPEGLVNPVPRRGQDIDELLAAVDLRQELKIREELGELKPKESAAEPEGDPREKEILPPIKTKEELRSVTEDRKTLLTPENIPVDVSVLTVQKAREKIKATESLTALERMLVLEQSRKEGPRAGVISLINDQAQVIRDTQI